MSDKKLNKHEIKKILNFPKTQVDGKISNMAYVDKYSARTKLGGIYVTIYPVINKKIKGPREVRQSLIMDSVVRKNIVSLAQNKKNKKKKKPLSTKKTLPKRPLFISM